MKKIKQKKLEQTVLTPMLLRIWENLWPGLKCQTPKTLDYYIWVFYLISRSYRNMANHIFLQLSNPGCSVEICLADIDHDLEWLVSTSNDVLEECKSHYVLRRRQRRLLARIQQKNELIWEKFNERLELIKDANEELLYEEIVDYPAEEIPYKKDFSVILKAFQYFKFQMN